MKIYQKVASFLVIAIFLFSGFIKLNDPIGTEIKLEEYFDVFSQDFEWMAGFWKSLIPFSLLFSIGLSSLEVILGIALLVQYRTRKILWVLLGLILFFSFLTFYSAYFNKVTDCGCFGEAIKLTPWTSFSKDIFLLVLIVFLLITSDSSKENKSFLIVFISAIFSIGFGLYSYFYLPIWDSLPYAIGQNIPKNMAQREALKFEYTYKIKGDLVKLSEMPNDTSAEFVSMEAINEKEARPLITDYKIWIDNDTIDYTSESFKGNRLMIILPNVNHTKASAFEKIGTLAKELEQKNIPTWLLSAASAEENNNLRHQYQLSFPVLSADTKILKTIIRSNPGLWLLSNGTVKGKWSAYHLPSSEEIVNSLTKVQE
ncbi:MAG: hypothetical protein RJA76_1508 [Bacteroidota bacterium]|jgi:uncharacterized membrane protein YphA (DoxX/SURF4 family)